MNLREAVFKLTKDCPPIVRDLAHKDTRRQAASSLVDLDLGNGNGTLRKVVQDYTNDLDSKEIGFIRWALDVLKGLFDQKGIARILDEIKTELKAKIPTLDIPLSSELVHEGRKTGVFTFPDVKDKTGQEYKVSLIVDTKSYKLLHLNIGRPHLDGKECSLDYQIPLMGGNADQEILKLIQDNQKILPEKK
jgi:hypothetical protein